MGFKTREEAEGDAQEVLQLLDYPNFKISIYQNLGWQWVIQNGEISVHPSTIESGKVYSQIMPTHHKYYGMTTTYRNPNLAVAQAVDQVKNHLDQTSKKWRNIQSSLIKRSSEDDEDEESGPL